MKQILLFFATLCSVILSAQDYSNMAFVSVSSNGKEYPKGKVYIDEPKGETLTEREVYDYRNSLGFCLQNAGYTVISDIKKADIILMAEVTHGEPSMQLNCKVSNFYITIYPMMPRDEGRPLFYDIRIAITHECTWKDAFMYTGAALLDNQALLKPKSFNAWRSRNDQTREEVSSVTRLRQIVK